MTGKSPIRSSLLIGSFLLSGSYVLAQPVPVVDAGSQQQNSNQGFGTNQAPVQQVAPVAPTGNNNNEVMINMYLQLEAMQQEIQNLRGIVEEQTYQIRRMQTEQRDRYLDLDSRIQAIGGGTGAAPTAGSNFNSPATTPNNQAGFTRSSVNGNANTGTGNGTNIGGNNRNTAGVSSNAGVGNLVPETTSPPVQGPQAEQQLYRSALSLLLDQEQYEQSVNQFQRYLDQYPGGRYFTNALYWQGEALILLERYNLAQTVFNRLLEDFPSDDKAPGAMLKLGTVYNLLGNTELAIQTWTALPQRYPASSTEIKYAEEFLQGVR